MMINLNPPPSPLKRIISTKVSYMLPVALFINIYCCPIVLRCLKQEKSLQLIRTDIFKTLNICLLLSLSRLIFIAGRDRFNIILQNFIHCQFHLQQLLLILQNLSIFLFKKVLIVNCTLDSIKYIRQVITLKKHMQILIRQRSRFNHMNSMTMYF